MTRDAQDSGNPRTRDFFDVLRGVLAGTTSLIGLILGLYWLVMNNGLIGWAALIVVAIAAVLWAGTRTRTVVLTYVEPLQAGVSGDQTLHLLPGDRLEWEVSADSPIDLEVRVGDQARRSSTRLLSQTAFLTASTRGVHVFRITPRETKELGNARVHIIVFRAAWRALLLKLPAGKHQQ